MAGRRKEGMVWVSVVTGEREGELGVYGLMASFLQRRGGGLVGWE